MPTLKPQTNAPRQIFHIDACSLYHIRGGFCLSWTYKRYNLVTEDELSTISWEVNNAEASEHGHQYGHHSKKGYGMKPVTSEDRW